MEFRVLGPLEVLDGGRSLPLGSLKQRTLLAALLVDAGRVVSSDRLLDILWGDRPPANGLGALQTYVSRLRRVVDPGKDPGSGSAVLVGTPPGYVLRLESGQLDAAGFEERVADARARAVTDPAGALELFTDAMGMWRGPALAEFADAEFARAEATRLEGLRLAAAEDRGDLRLALGEHNELIGELKALVGLHPLQERPRAQLMVALYRAGRQVDALHEFQEHRRALAEMGLEPSAELRALETSIVRQEPELAWESVPGSDRVKSNAGASPAPALPEGVLTFLLTDIEESTALWDAAPSAMAEALARHEQIVHEAVAARGGILVKSKGEGDSTLSVFPQATAAVAAAVALQLQLTAEEWNGGLELKTRVGLHTGEVQLREGDYYGGTLNRAARIRALATGERILCSRATADLVAESLPDDASLVELGTQQLRGLRRSETIYALTHPDLPDPGPGAFPRGAVPRFDVPLPARLAITTAPFAGREREVAALQAAFEAVRADGSRRVVLIGGEPGIGKTTLASRAARAAHDGGALVLYGRCDEELGAPFQMWSQALGHLIRHAPDALLDAHLSAQGGRLAAFVPGLMERGATPVPPSTDPEADRYLLYGAVVDLLERAAEVAPVVLLLDDLHWCDLSSMQLFRHVLTTDLSLPLLVIGTFRDTEVTEEDPFAAVLAGLHREPGVERIALVGLDEDALSTLLETAAGHALTADDLALRDALAAETDGNPFFVIELLRHLAETGVIARADSGPWYFPGELARLSLPTSVREVVTQRLARLGDEPRRVLGLASVIGREFEVGLLGDVSELDEATVLDVLDSATAAALVRPIAEADRYTFVHALIERTLFASFSPARRRRAHTRVAAALEARYGADPGERVNELAHHWLEAGIDSRKAIDYAVRAGEYAHWRLAFEEALQWYQRAFDLLDDTAVDDRCRAEVFCGLGLAQRNTGHAAFRDTLLEASSLAERIGDHALLARAALANTRGWSVVGHVDHERIAVLESVAGKVDDRVTRARILARLADELPPAQVQRRRALIEEALALGRDTDDTAALIDLIGCSVCVPLWAPGVKEQRLELMALAVERAEALAVPSTAAGANFLLAGTLLEMCDLEGYDRHEAAALAFGARSGSAMRWWPECLHATRLMLAGDLDAAEHQIGVALELGLSSGQPDAAIIAGAQDFGVRVMQGRLDEFADNWKSVVAAVSDQPEVYASFRGAAALALAEVGREDEALELAEELSADDFAMWPVNNMWLMSMVTLASVVARCGASAIAARMLPRLEPCAGYLAYNGPNVGGVADFYLGLLCRTVGRIDEALAHLNRAAELHERLQTPFYIALTDLERARTLLTRGEPGDEARADELLAAVELVANDRGFGGLRRQVDALGRKL